MHEAMFTPSLQELRAYASEGFCRIPIACEIYSDVRTPIEVVRILKQTSKHCFMLESAESNRQWGRYTFIGGTPSMEITLRDGVLIIDEEEQDASDPLEAIRAVLRSRRAPRIPELPPFAGGLVGYFSYDFLKYSEPSLTLDAPDDESFNDVDLMLFETVIVFDAYRQKIVLIGNVDASDVDASYARTRRELEELAELICTGVPITNTHGRRSSEFRTLFDEKAYCDIVSRAQEHIREGDIFQVVLSNRLDADFEGSLLDCYRVLRAMNPSPYMFYFSSESIELAGASPETLVQLQDGTVSTFPLAGTRARGATDEKDAALEAELLADEKELAEHNMLVDLGRNDVGRVSEFGSVRVENYHQVLKFSHVMHIGSTVRGKLRDECDALDALSAVLPAGTLSGAPKIRATQIINDLEQCKRGVYGGAIGYIDLSGNMDTCIAIRLAFARGGRVFVRSGAGIVADSVPENENRECINKAAAVVEALRIAEGGLQ